MSAQKAPSSTPKRRTSGLGGNKGPEWIQCNDTNLFYHTLDSKLHKEALAKGTGSNNYVTVPKPGYFTGPLTQISRKETRWAQPRCASILSRSILVSEALMKTGRISFGDNVRVTLGKKKEQKWVMKVLPHNTAPTANKIMLTKEAWRAVNKNKEPMTVQVTKMTDPIHLAKALTLRGDLQGLDVAEVTTALRGDFQEAIFALHHKLFLFCYGLELTLTVSGIEYDGEGNNDLEGQLKRMSLRSSKKCNAAVMGWETRLVVVDSVLEEKEQKEDNKKAVPIGGLDIQMEMLVKALRPCLKERTDNKVRPVNGALLWGAPGTGKTLLGRALAPALNANMLQLNASELSSKFYGETEGNIRKKFDEARDLQPCIVFIDELDALCPQKSESTGRSDQERRVSSALVSLFDEVNTNGERIAIVAATSRPSDIDRTLRRPGRLDFEVELPVPTSDQRRDILKALLEAQSHQLTADDVSDVSKATHGFVGADLYALIGEAQDECDNDSIQFTDMERALKIIKPSAMREVLIEVPTVTWDDIGGLDKLKLNLKQAVEWPFKHPEALKRLGITAPKGILMYGPPGCSKTMIAKALANESGLNFLAIKGPELFSKWVGESERAVRELFRKARQVAPAIIFFDEIDALGAERAGSGGGGSKVGDRVLAQLLTEMDGIEALKNVTIVAATNRPDMIDKALMRPGRLDRLFYVPLPDAATRAKVLSIHTKRKPVSADVDFESMVDLTEGYSGAELAAVCNEAALKALEENIDAVSVQPRHFVAALEKVKPRIRKDLMKIYDQFHAER